jgi:hypothetical protein
MRGRGFFKKAFLFLGLSLLLTIIQAGAGQTSIFKLKVIVLRGANIRSKPDITGVILKAVPFETLLESPGKEGRWYRVSLPPDAQGITVTGYIYDSLVAIVEEIKIEPTKVTAPPRPKIEETVVEKVEPAQKPQPEVALPAPPKRSFCFRFYGKMGKLLTPPSAADLSYFEAGGGNLDKFLSVAQDNFGGGFQLLFSLNPENTTRVGVDLGAQKLYFSTFNPGTNESVYEDIQNEKEYASYLLGLLELRSRRSPLFLQIGAGMHLIYWSWDYTYRELYYEEHKENSGFEVNMGFLLSAGFDIPLAQWISIPITLRMDGLLRHGSLINASASIGLSFH